MSLLFTFQKSIKKFTIYSFFSLSTFQETLTTKGLESALNPGSNKLSCRDNIQATWTVSKIACGTE
jgi:hypothetical protein